MQQDKPTHIPRLLPSALWHVADSDELMRVRIGFVAFVVGTEIIFGLRKYVTITTIIITTTFSMAIAALALLAAAYLLRCSSGRVASRQ